MSDDSTQQTDTTDTTPAAPKEKRTRTSPRVKALDECLVMIDAHCTDLQEEAKEGATKARTAAITAQLEVLGDIRGKVVEMSNEGPSKLEYAGRHYLGVSADGTRVAIDSNVPPTRRSHGPESKHAFTSVLGPFRTEDGVAYRIAHPETDCAIVF